MKWMGLDARMIKVDGADRKGKSASPFCSAVKVPTDVRISFRKSNPLEEFTGVFHEFGHGIHFSSIVADRPFWSRYYVPMGVAEIFSIFFEGLMHDGKYLRDELGLSASITSDLLSRFTFNQLYFATFYSANSVMKLRYWHDALSMDEATNLYEELTEKYMGIRYPGEYWYLHHVLPDYILYSPSYLLAGVRAHKLAEVLRSRFGETYWRETGTGRFLMDKMRLGREMELDDSYRDVGSYVRLLSQHAA
jgi:oligoendopeptidase F